MARGYSIPTYMQYGPYGFGLSAIIVPTGFVDSSLILPEIEKEEESTLTLEAEVGNYLDNNKVSFDKGGKLIASGGDM